MFKIQHVVFCCTKLERGMRKSKQHSLKISNLSFLCIFCIQAM